MRGYDSDTYGDAFADVYDDWYDDVSDTDAMVRLVAAEARAVADAAGDTEALAVELGVGTGRLAVPLALTGTDVVGIDTSAAMLARLAAKASAAGAVVQAVHDDMVSALAGRTGCHVVFVAYNTLFSLPTVEQQAACFAAVAGALVEGGRFVVEAFVPPEADPDGGTRRSSAVGVRSIAADRVVLSVDTTDPAAQVAEGQYVELTESGGVRLRPWRIRWSTPAQLDEMARSAGLALVARWAGADRTPFDGDAERHVSVYARRTDGA